MAISHTCLSANRSLNWMLSQSFLLVFLLHIIQLVLLFPDLRTIGGEFRISPDILNISNVDTPHFSHVGVQVLTLQICAQSQVLESVTRFRSWVLVQDLCSPSLAPENMLFFNRFNINNFFLILVFYHWQNV